MVQLAKSTNAGRNTFAERETNPKNGKTKMWLVRNRQIAREHVPDECERELEEDGETSRQRMGGVELATLIDITSTHPLPESACPVRSGLRQNADVQPHAGVDVPEAESRD